MNKEKVNVMLNEQINKELFSAYLYLAISDYYSEKNLDGFANWFEVQAKEELDHAMLFRKYMLDDGTAVRFAAVECPEVAYKAPKDCLVAALGHEEMITASINDIYEEAMKCKDYKTLEFLNWFVKEQGEEEKNATDLLKKFELFGDDPKSLYMLNAELLTRAYTAPSLVL